jgi:hypothetical protein
MRRHLGMVASASFVLLLVACGPRARGDQDGSTGDDVPGDDTPGDDIDAADFPDSRTGGAYPDSMPFPDGGTCGDQWVCDNPVDDECDPPHAETCGNGSDEDCDGDIDEECPCTPGTVQGCFRGQPGRRGVGACVDGTQTCQGGDEFGVWGPCVGGITPQTETCDGLDNDCNGCADDNPECCSVLLACPDSSTMPEGSPFVDYVIDASSFYSGPVTSYSWTVTGGPCDQLFVANGNAPSYTLMGTNSPVLTISPTLSGDLTVTVVMTLPDGTTHECTFVIHIGGPGLRIEACWDVAPDADIDLHLHRPGTTTPWFQTAVGAYNPDDCYYMNCKATSFATVPNWGYANSPLAECEGGPEGGQWQTLGYCRNPRLDVDNIYDYGPENINVDVPQDGGNYRIMLHYYSGSAVAHPIIDVYCGGHLRATFGQAPDVVTGFDTGGGYNAGLMWRVADVAPVVVGGVTTDCVITPLHPPASPSGYWVTNNVSTY